MSEDPLSPPQPSLKLPPATIYHNDVAIVEPTSRRATSSAESSATTKRAAAEYMKHYALLNQRIAKDSPLLLTWFKGKLALLMARSERRMHLHSQSLSRELLKLTLDSQILLHDYFCRHFSGIHGDSKLVIAKSNYTPDSPRLINRRQKNVHYQLPTTFSPTVEVRG